MTREHEPSTDPGRAAVKSARSVVVKIGTAVLTGGTGVLDRAYFHDLSALIAAERRAGRRVLIVSSGAVGAGVGALGLTERPSDMGLLQAAAAAGQPLLMSLWRDAFAVRSTSVAQILLSRADLDSRERFLNIRNCVHALHAVGAVPIVNENDTVATEEISLGDNDQLAAKVAVAVEAEALVILTTGPGVLDDQDRVVASAADAESLKCWIRPMKTGQGRGGMATKLEAARIGSETGVVTIIAPGRPVDTLQRVLAGEQVGTCVGGGGGRRTGRRAWIGYSATPSGSIMLDEGAARAVRERGASLLAKGVSGLSGSFQPGDVVALKDAAGAEIGRGLTNLSSDELRLVQGKESLEFERILGRRTFEEVVHRDNFVRTGAGPADY